MPETNGTAWESLGALVTSRGSCPAERAECKHFERHIHHHVTTALWLADTDRAGPDRAGPGRTEPATGYRLPATQRRMLPNAHGKNDAICPERNAKSWSLISSCDVGTSDVILQLILLYYSLQDGAHAAKHVAVGHWRELCLMIWNCSVFS